MKLDREPDVKTIPAHVSGFSKVANLKIPDSPPPEKEEEDFSQPGKFEHLMQAACSIKQTEMEGRRRKFERLPAFLKAGVYYTTKLEATRKQGYFQRLFAFQLIMKSANQEYHTGNASGACRKYEEVSLTHPREELTLKRALLIMHDVRTFCFRPTAFGATSRATTPSGTPRASTTPSLLKKSGKATRPRRKN